MKLKIYNIQSTLFKQQSLLYVLMTILLFLSACKKFLHVDLPESRIVNTQVFSDSISASSAITGIYADMLQADNFASGSNQSITALAGLSADELINYPESPDAVAFQENMLSPNNSLITSLWNSFYKIIYEANAALEGISSSSGLTENAKNVFRGECLFIRSFCYFYLVNTFGPVPLAKISNYEINQKLSRTASNIVNEQIIEDLKESQHLLGIDYVIPAKIRPNNGAATALLARVYLYQKKWADAIVESSKLIDGGNYILEDSLDDVFLKTSREAIWQLANVAVDENTFEGRYFIINDFAQFNTLVPQFPALFEGGDFRLQHWIGIFDTGADPLYYPFKYKKSVPIDVTQGEQITEYSMVLRLAEQYLIRAEANANLENYPDAIHDLDKIRLRAGLQPFENQNPGPSKDDLLNAIAHERRVELFTEWGHRWYDLKRTEKATDILGTLKADWSVDDLLYPIPQTEFAKNPYLGEQNSGY